MHQSDGLLGYVLHPYIGSLCCINNQHIPAKACSKYLPSSDLVCLVLSYVILMDDTLLLFCCQHDS